MPSDVPSPDPPADGFAALGLGDELLAELEELGYEEPTPIQRQAIPVQREGRDVVGRAATGTGKTAAFALPLLDRLVHSERGVHPAAIVLVPTRELAMQVAEAVHRYGRQVDVRVVPLFGGQPIGRQIDALRRGCDVVVATPGRALDLLRRRVLDLGRVATVVLDEADEMLDMGFVEDLDAILDEAPDERQTVLFSATMPPRIEKLASKHLNDPVTVTIEALPRTGSSKVREAAYVVHRSDKPAALARLLDVERPDAALVFCRTRHEVDSLTETLIGRGYRAEALHGGMSQEQRDKVMGRLRSGNAELLVATDVAARGLDVDTLTHVVNYGVPAAPETYVHRIGRVGRAGRTGVALTIAEPRERRLLRNVERVTTRDLEEAGLPTVADLRARQLEHSSELLRQRLADVDGLGRFVQQAEELAHGVDDHENPLLAVAAAALSLVNDGIVGAGQDEVDIPTVRPARRADAARDGDRGGRDRRSTARQARKGASDRSGGAGRDRRPSGDTGRVFVGLGKDAGVRPADLVGAITGESSLRGGDIGAIRIAPRHALVEVPAGRVDEVVRALKGTTIKGRRPNVRPDREGADHARPDRAGRGRGGSESR